jgi:hypothetical protein
MKMKQEELDAKDLVDQALTEIGLYPILNDPAKVPGIRKGNRSLIAVFVSQATVSLPPEDARQGLSLLKGVRKASFVDHPAHEQYVQTACMFASLPNHDIQTDAIDLLLQVAPHDPVAMKGLLQSLYLHVHVWKHQQSMLQEQSSYVPASDQIPLIEIAEHVARVTNKFAKDNVNLDDDAQDLFFALVSEFYTLGDREALKELRGALRRILELCPTKTAEFTDCLHNNRTNSANHPSSIQYDTHFVFTRLEDSFYSLGILAERASRLDPKDETRVKAAGEISQWVDIGSRSGARFLRGALARQLDTVSHFLPELSDLCIDVRSRLKNDEMRSVRDALDAGADLLQKILNKSSQRDELQR